MKTAQPMGDPATNQTPPPIANRQPVSYRKTKIFARWVTVVLGTIIFGCAQTLSYVHTLHLFQNYGYIGWQAHMGVVMFEALFFLGAFTTMIFHFIGANPGIPVRIATLLGAGFVGWSNISYGFEYGHGGVVIGVAIILCAIVAEMVAGRAILHTGREEENQVEPSAGKVENTQTLEVPSPPSTLTSTGLEPEVEKVEKGGSGSAVDILESKVEPSTVGLEVEVLGTGQVEITSPPSSPNPGLKAGKVEVEKQETSTTPQEVKEKVEVEPAPALTEEQKQVEKLETKETSTIVYSPGDDPLEVALQIMKVEKKRPGRPRLMKAGMSEHTAKMTAAKVTKYLQAQAG